jgi:hypothetical protein
MRPSFDIVLYISADSMQQISCNAVKFFISIFINSVD